MILYVFDLDKTLITKDSYDLWHEYLQEIGVLGANFIAKNNEMIALYDEGKMDMLEYLAFSIESLNSLSVSQIAELMPKFLQEKIAPIARKECEIWRNLSPKLVISATPLYVVKPVAKMLGFDEAIGVNLVVKNEHYTSEFVPPLSYQAGKIEALKIWQKNHGLENAKIHFFTDSINDLPMCEHADICTCVEPDEKLRKKAIENNWEILD